jgi:bifunctional non-homologous end joining protein LigD
MILDGELVAFDANGKPSFGALQDRAQLKTEREIAAPTQHARRLLLLRSAAFRGNRFAQIAYQDRRRYLRNACCRPISFSWCTRSEMASR